MGNDLPIDYECDGRGQYGNARLPEERNIRSAVTETAEMTVQGSPYKVRRYRGREDAG